MDELSKNHQQGEPSKEAKAMAEGGGWRFVDRSRSSRNTGTSSLRENRDRNDARPREGVSKVMGPTMQRCRIFRKRNDAPLTRDRDGTGEFRQHAES